MIHRFRWYSEPRDRYCLSFENRFYLENNDFHGNWRSEKNRKRNFKTHTVYLFLVSFDVPVVRYCLLFVIDSLSSTTLCPSRREKSICQGEPRREGVVVLTVRSILEYLSFLYSLVPCPFLFPKTFLNHESTH